MKSMYGWVWSLMLIGASCLVLGACDSDDTGEPQDTTPDDNNSTLSMCQSDFQCPTGRFCIDNICRDPGDECASDDECDGDKICNVGFCIERPAECEQDTDCDSEEVCDNEQRCRRGCRENSQCDSDERCDQDTLRCILDRPECPESCPTHQDCNRENGMCEPDGTCTVNNDCASGLECEEGTCIVPPSPCQRSVNCEEGFFCNVANLCQEGCRQANECEASEICVNGLCTEEIPECDEDDLEPDNTPEEASPLASGQTVDGLTICDDADWFTFIAFAGDEVNIAARFRNDDGNINLRLFDPDDNLLQLLGSQNDTETLTRVVSASGLYKVEVFGGGRGVYNNYDLTLDVTRNCEADVLEENDTAEEPTLVTESMVSYEGLSLCEEDEDWFMVPLYPGETMDVSLQFLHIAGDLSLELYNGQGELMETAQTEENEEMLTLTTETRQDVLLRVPGAPELINLYDLNITTTPAACEDPEAEEETDNNTAANATEVVTGVTQEGVICAGDEDWYRLTLPAEVTLSAVLDVVEDISDLTLTLFDLDGETVLAQGEANEGSFAVDIQTALPGSYLLRVRGEGRSQGAYSVRFEGGPEATCPEDDRLEADEDFTLPVALTPGGYGDLLLCGAPAQEDWFSVTLAEGESFEVFALAAAQDGQVQVALFAPDAVDADAEPFDMVTGEGEVKRVRAQIGSPAGQWKVRVWSTEEGDVRYALRINTYEGFLPLDCEFDDSFEPNEEPRDASRIEGRRSYEAVICPGNQDWYRVDANAGDEINVNLDFTHNDEGDLTAALFTADDLNNPAVVGDSETDGELLNWRADVDGPFFVRVSLRGPEGSVYRLTSSALPGADDPGCILDDSFEPNNSAEDAATRDPGLAQGILCNGDQDWYAVPLVAGQQVRAWVAFDGDTPPALSLHLRDAESTVLDAEMLPPEFDGPGVLSLDWTATEDSDAALALIGAEGADVLYGLWFEVSDLPVALCDEMEADEPNENPRQAQTLELPVMMPGRVLCGDDEDWFRVDLTEGQGMRATTSHDLAEGNVQMEVYDTEGGGLGASYSSFERDTLFIDGGDESKTVYVRTFLEEPGPATTYDLDIMVDENLCQADEFEPNETQGTASSLAQGQLIEASFCSLDGEDWYRFTINGFGFYSVITTIEFDGEAADLDLEVHDLFFGVVGRADGVGDQERLVLEPLGQGEYWVRVYRIGEGQSDYTLRVDVRSF